MKKELINQLTKANVFPRLAKEAIHYYYNKNTDEVEIPNELDLFPSKTHKIAASNNSYGIYIEGPIGSGKSVLSAALLAKNAQKLTPISEVDLEEEEEEFLMFYSVPRLLTDIKRSFDPNPSISSSAIIDKCIDSKILVLDDIGAQSSTVWALETLYIIIDDRYGNYKPTIFTSNYTIQDLKDQIGDSRIPSRISGMCEVFSMKNMTIKNS